MGVKEKLKHIVESDQERETLATHSEHIAL